MVRQRMTLKPVHLIAGGAVLAALAYVVWRGGIKGAAAGAASAAVDAASGVVIGLGQSVGIPATDMTQCERDLAAGNTWDASFSCPAGTFIGSFF